MREICPPDHKHAEKSTCYVKHRCGCAPCRVAARVRESNRRRQQAYGRYDTGLVDAGPVRAHVQKLRDAGMGWKRVAEVAGVGATCVETLIYGHKTRKTLHARISRVNAEKIMAVQVSLDTLRPGALIPARGAQRRLQALVWQGWSLLRLSEMLGREREYAQALMKRTEVTVAGYQAIDRLYREWWDKPRPVTRPHDKTSIARAKNMAARNGWVSGMAWDDIDLDDAPMVVDEPDDTEVVDPVEVDLAVTGERPATSTAVAAEAVRVLHARKWSDVRIGERIGRTAGYVFWIRSRDGLVTWERDELEVA